MRFQKFLALVPLLAFVMFSQSAFAEERGSKLCDYVPKENPTFSSAFVAKNANLKVDVGEEFVVNVFVKNTGNTPWFSQNSGCEGSKVSLSTDKNPNRSSEIYLESDPRWESESKISLDQERVDPGEVASFTFRGKYDKKDILKEYFVPIVDGTRRLNESSFSLDLIVGDQDISIPDMRKKLVYSTESGSTKHINPKGSKVMRVDLSDQTVNLELDGVSIRQFRVSTGAAKTPTPIGTYEISLKQELRIGGKWPHYHMPKFMWFRAGGYGFHALPYLVNDRGTFWSEALDHIGRPASHGCVRMLPDDADFAFDFATIGTQVVVQR